MIDLDRFRNWLFLLALGRAIALLFVVLCFVMAWRAHKDAQSIAGAAAVSNDGFAHCIHDLKTCETNLMEEHKRTEACLDEQSTGDRLR